MNIELLFSTANILYLFGTIFLIRRVMKNRKVLKDFDFYGSLINTIGMSANILALIMLTFYITVVISIPTFLFWAAVSYYSFKNRR